MGVRICLRASGYFAGLRAPFVAVRQSALLLSPLFGACFESLSVCGRVMGVRSRGSLILSFKVFVKSSQGDWGDFGSSEGLEGSGRATGRLGFGERGAVRASRSRVRGEPVEGQEGAEAVRRERRRESG